MILSISPRAWGIWHHFLKVCVKPPVCPWSVLGIFTNQCIIIYDCCLFTTVSMKVAEWKINTKLRKRFVQKSFQSFTGSMQGGKGGVPITNHEPIFVQLTNHVWFLKHFSNHAFNIHHCKKITPN